VNWDSIAEIAGQDDTDFWPGTKIEMYRATTDVKGKPTPCVRVRAPTTKPMSTPPTTKELSDEIPDLAKS
jgi:hypothetical protein